MKKDMAEYLNALSADNLTTFELIISSQYRKFVRFYKLVSQYSHLIEKIKYSFHDVRTLDVMLTMDVSADVKGIKKEIDESMRRNGYQGTVRVSKRNMYMTIFLVEK